MLSLEQRRAARRAFAREVRQSQTPQTEPATAKANVLRPPVAESPSSTERRPVRMAIVTPVLYVGGAEQWIASLAHWLDPDRAVVTKVIVLFPNAINPVAVSWLPRWVEVVDSRTIEQDGSFDVLITWGLKDLVERISHLTCPTIDVQHGVFRHESWQGPLVAAATRAHELYGTTIVGVNEAVRQNFPEHVCGKVVIIPNGSDPGRVYPLVDRNELKASLGLSPEHKVAIYIGRIAVEKNVQSLIDAVEHLDDSWHAVLVGP
jgi:glycosyltransferase involved in cell wall biosynthesis